MKWKSTVAIAATLALAAGLAGCTGTSTSNSSGWGKKPSIVFVPGDLKDEFWITMSCGVKAAAKKAGADVSVQAGQDGTAATQKPLVDSIVAKHPDVLVISPDDSAAMQAPIQAASAAGIKVVLVNNTVTDPSFAVSQVLSNDKDGGADAFKAIQQLHPDGGKLLVIGTQPGFQNTDDRVTGFANAVKTDSKFSYVGVQYSQNSPQTAAQLVGSALQKDPDIVGIFAVNVNSAEGAATGLQQAGKASSVSLIGYDAGPGQIKDLQSGVVQGLIAQQPSTIGMDGVEQGLAALKGTSTQKEIRTPLTIITKDNVDTVGKTAAYVSSCK
jgi:ribose transport system substrate-binding protein